jgi:hypothetical protein
VDEDAAMRQILRPAETRAAQADGFGYDVGKRAIDAIDQYGTEAGQNVSQARNALVENRGAQIPGGTDDIADNTGKFLARNTDSAAGFSGISNKEREALQSYSESLKGANAEDLVKLREQIDGKLSHLYGNEGAASPYERQLMQMRGQADSILDKFDPNLNSANTEYSDYLNNKSLLGLNRESTAETVTNNLYSGANKTAKQAAAEALIPGQQLEQFKDIAANKAFANAKGPSGSEFGVRRIMGIAGAIPTKGASLVATDPGAWKQGLRALGSTENLVSDLIQQAPERLGQFYEPLAAAMQRGPQALAATHFILQQTQPEYRAIINSHTDSNGN